MDVVRYSEQPLAAQREIKQCINTAVKQATVRLAPGERVLLDTGDGVAIAFLGNPEDALFVALGLRQALGTLAVPRSVLLRTGINFGKVSVLRDVNGQPSVIGDGINMAQRVMSFANPGQLLVSRAFYQVLVGLADDYADLFAYCGARTDKHVREHELYELAAPLDQIEIDLLPWTSRARSEHSPADTAPPPQPEPSPRRTSRALWLASAAVLVSALIAAHALVGGRLARPAAADRPTASAAAATARPSAPPLASPRGPLRRTRLAAEAAARQTAITQGSTEESARQAAATRNAAAHDLAAASATLSFAIAPWGEVRVDGRSYGASPPLTHLPLPPGEHWIEIDNGVSDPYRAAVRLNAGQALRIQHNFESPQPRE